MIHSVSLKMIQCDLGPSSAGGLTFWPHQHLWAETIPANQRPTYINGDSCRQHAARGLCNGYMGIRLLMFNVVCCDDYCTASGLTLPQSNYVMYVCFFISLYLFWLSDYVSAFPGCQSALWRWTLCPQWPQTERRLLHDTLCTWYVSWSSNPQICGSDLQH